MPVKKAAPLKSAKPFGLNAALAKPAKSASKSKDKFEPKRDLAPERVAEILKRLSAAYPDAECALHHRNAWELLVATILFPLILGAVTAYLSYLSSYKYATTSALGACVDV